MTYNVFEDSAADTRHADAQGKLVVESSAKLHPLQLGGVTHSLQSHSQQSADTWRQKTQKQMTFVCNFSTNCFINCYYNTLQEIQAFISTAQAQRPAQSGRPWLQDLPLAPKTVWVGVTCMWFNEDKYGGLFCVMALRSSCELLKSIGAEEGEAFHTV